jgi:hypothetical protein
MTGKGDGMSAAPRRAYDHGLRELVCESVNLHLVTKIGVPKATAASWMCRGYPDVLRFDSLGRQAAWFEHLGAATLSREEKEEKAVARQPLPVGSQLCGGVETRPRILLSE